MVGLSLLFDIYGCKRNRNEWFQNRPFNKAKHDASTHSSEELEEETLCAATVIRNNNR